MKLVLLLSELLLTSRFLNFSSVSLIFFDLFELILFIFFLNLLHSKLLVNELLNFFPLFLLYFPNGFHFLLQHAWLVSSCSNRTRLSAGNSLAILGCTSSRWVNTRPHEITGWWLNKLGESRGRLSEWLATIALLESILWYVTTFSCLVSLSLIHLSIIFIRKHRIGNRAITHQLRVLR